ncbi:hypothetical protein PALB_20860 [Pseudoalteromonas luteoviolacea B = ATCC 29581]|nr:hypothetical protein PALB_20860 [Pseudoalteromonas luteoviolacea B = ATCC 29581]
MPFYSKYQTVKADPIAPLSNYTKIPRLSARCLLELVLSA